MLEFIRNSFRTVFTIMLWVILISLTICGGIIGYFMGNQIDFIPSFVFIIVGVILGLFLGFMIIIVGGGMVAILMNMDQNIEKMLKVFVAEKKKSYTGNADGAKWNCPKCNNPNPNSTYQCEKCGYKLA